MSKPVVAVLVATDAEFEAARFVLEKCYRAVAKFGPRSFLCELERIFLLTETLPHMGNIDAALGTQEIIKQYRPICVIGAGTCAGTQIQKQPRNFCDIVVATDVIYYEPSKKSPSSHERRPRRFESRIPEQLRKRIAPPVTELFELKKPKCAARPNPAVHHGFYASGDSVLADAQFVRDLRNRTRDEYGQDIAAIEMEGAGIALACEATDTKFTMAKAIMDFAGEEKNDAWQKYAAVVSFGAVANWARSFTENELALLHLRSLPHFMPDPYERGARMVFLAGSMLPARGVSLAHVTERRVDDFVTHYDIRSERLMLKGLCEPKDEFVSEESPKHNKKCPKAGKGKYWIVDPVDGTQNLVAGRPEVAISVALYEGLQPSLAVIRLPYRGLTIGIAKATNLEVNGVPWVRRHPPAKRVEDAVVALPGDLRRLKGTGLEVIIPKIASHAAGIRITGALAYDLACLALGEFDARISTSAKLVDVAAGAELIRRTGGKITDLHGSEWTPKSRTVLAAGTPELHSALLKLIQHE